MNSCCVENYKLRLQYICACAMYLNAIDGLMCHPAMMEVSEPIRRVLEIILIMVPIGLSKRAGRWIFLATKYVDVLLDFERV